MLPPEAARSPTTHKIHILGDDVRSKFIAHALSGVYDSVELLAWTRPSKSEYRNVMPAQPGNAPNLLKVGRSKAPPRTYVQDDSSHIDQLVVTGGGYETAGALEAVKHRVDENTDICVMNDGLGVLDDVRQKIFNTPESSPNFFLGHMSHRLVMNRKYETVKELKGGQLRMTRAKAFGADNEEVDFSRTSRPNFYETLRSVEDLRTCWNEYDQWLRFKLPSVLLGTAVDPVCAILGLKYHDVPQNKDAMKMVNRLLGEVSTVLDNLPELQDSTLIRDFTHGKGLSRTVWSSIMAKRWEPSRLVQQISMGLPTDVDYLNGYFLRRADQLGVEMPMNRIMRDMVKAKHSRKIEQRNSYIPMEETSIPSDQEGRYRTTLDSRDRRNKR